MKKSYFIAVGLFLLPSIGFSTIDLQSCSKEQRELREAEIAKLNIRVENREKSLGGKDEQANVTLKKEIAALNLLSTRYQHANVNCMVKTLSKKRAELGAAFKMGAQLKKALQDQQVLQAKMDTLTAEITALTREEKKFAQAEKDIQIKARDLDAIQKAAGFIKKDPKLGQTTASTEANPAVSEGKAKKSFFSWFPFCGSKKTKGSSKKAE